MVVECKSPAIYIGWEGDAFDWRIVEVKPGKAEGKTLAQGKAQSASDAARAVKRAQAALGV